MSAPPGTEHGSAAGLDSPGPAAAANGNAEAPPTARAGSRLMECWGSGGTPRPNGPRAPEPGQHPPRRAAPSHPAWNNSRAGASTAAPANLGHCRSTHSGKNCIRISNVSVPSFTLKPPPPSLIPMRLCKKSLALFKICQQAKATPEFTFSHYWMRMSTPQAGP